MYLDASLQKVLTAGDTACWEFFLNKYVRAAATNLEERLIKTDHQLPFWCDTPMRIEYHPSGDISRELNAYRIQIYQDLIWILRWAVEVGRVDILLEVSLLLSHLALLRAGPIQAVYIVFVYLKQVPKRRLYFERDHPDISEDRFHDIDWDTFNRVAAEAIPLDMPWPRGKTMTSHYFVDVNHSGDNATRISMTCILIFCNRAPIIWYAKRQNGV